MRETLPDVKIIVSSRPDDDRFRSWESFSVYRVSEFTKEQAFELINKTKYNIGVKERFLQALETRLIYTHATFVSSPLLTTIMLLTFEEYAEIPTKMHSFYARAFDTLFQKHDADKDQFVRKIKTGLSKEDFKLVFSAFCAMSYMEERFSFSSSAINANVEQALKYSRQIINETENTKTSDFICDLRDVVCMLQPDGLDLTFVHRSFQEYFSAVFVKKSHGSRLKPLLDRFSRRFNDNVVGMALDMAREKVEAEWILPTIENYIAIFSRKNGVRNVGTLLSSLLPEASIYNERNGLIISSFSTNDEMLGPIESICRSYPDKLGPAFLIKTVRQLEVENVKKLLISDTNRRKGSYKAWSQVLEGTDDQRNEFRIRFSRKDNWWLEKLGFNDMFDELVEHLEQIKQSIITREENRADILVPFL